MSAKKFLIQLLVLVVLMIGVAACASGPKEDASAAATVAAAKATEAAAEATKAAAAQVLAQATQVARILPTDLPTSTPGLAITAAPSPVPATVVPTREPTEAPMATPGHTPTVVLTETPPHTPTLLPVTDLFAAGSRNADWRPVVEEMNGVPMVYVPAGCFMMGSADGGDDESPMHEVCLSTYWIGQTEVTNAHYKACVDAGICDPPAEREYFDDLTYADHPVVHVDWDNANAYAQWSLDGSLPTEAQWEYAARGPEGWTYPWGDGMPTCQRANTHECGLDEKTAPVGPDQRPMGASWVGALDMAGNVWEWVADWYSERYYGTLEEGSVLDPSGPASGYSRAVRGGSWRDKRTFVRAAYRSRNTPDLPGSRPYSRGFRVVAVSAPEGVPTGASGLIHAPTATHTPTAMPAPVVQEMNGVPMVYVPGGPFEMGSEDVGSYERPIHTVTLDDFYIDQYEVTNAEFAAFLNELGNQTEGGAAWLGADSRIVDIQQTDGVWQADKGFGDHPVVETTWYGAAAYCEWRGARLPTEAEWEKAARGTDGRTYPWGEGLDCGHAQYVICGGSTVPAGSFPDGASPYGAFDMAGNAAEWVADWFSDRYYFGSPPENPLGPMVGSSRVVRGGSWRSFVSSGTLASGTSVRSAHRGRLDPSQVSEYVGFRCALSP